MRMTFFLLLSLTLTESLIAQHIRFTSTELYPEGSAYSPKLKTFFVSSVHYGKLGKVDLSGNYTPFVDDQELVTTAGLLADDERGLLYVCIADPGVSIKTNPQTQGKLAKLAAYRMTDGKRMFLVDLGALNPGGSNFANDVTKDKQGNLYVTNSFAPIVYLVTPTGKASIFARNDSWTGAGFNLNGIVYHPAGFLLAAQSNTGKLYKIPLDEPSRVSVIDTDAIPGADGLILSNAAELLIISNSSNGVYRLSSTDSWLSARQTGTIATLGSFPTTGMIANDATYVLNAKLNEIFTPSAPKTSDFMLQRIDFPVSTNN